MIVMKDREVYGSDSSISRASSGLCYFAIIEQSPNMVGYC